MEGRGRGKIKLPIPGMQQAANVWINHRGNSVLLIDSGGVTRNTVNPTGLCDSGSLQGQDKSNVGKYLLSARGEPTRNSREFR